MGLFPALAFFFLVRIFKLKSTNSSPQEFMAIFLPITELYDYGEDKQSNKGNHFDQNKYLLTQPQGQHVFIQM